MAITTPAPPLPAPPPFAFQVPEGILALPLGDTEEEREVRARAFVRELYAEGDARVWEPAAAYYASLAEMMGAGGVSYAAVGLFATGPLDEEGRGRPGDGVAQCALSVAVAPTGQAAGDVDTVAQGLRAVLGADPLNDVRWLDLPCGPAVARITLTTYRLTPEVTADGAPGELPTGQIQAHVPFPNGPFTAVFTLDTASLDHWAEWCEVLATVLDTVSFDDQDA
ncbi:hypothetical protein AB0J21_04885 [Streptomyces sp. NPDC049954]|uniref:hypothetical protein n=1 Tax=Streptomyces sp. NPDC049954 TaxID=3155779 RepID=UPI00341B76EB